MRNIINKCVTHEQLLETAYEIYRRDWHTMKLIFVKRLFSLFLIFCFSLFIGVAIVSGQKTPADRDRDVTQMAAKDFRLYLPIIFTPPLTPPFDMVQFMGADGRLYEVQHSGGSQARHQTQSENPIFYHTKGNEISAEWEELWYDDQYIYRGTDTSPGNGMYYTLRDHRIYGSRWAPRFWDVGDVYERNPTVVFYFKSDCSVVTGGTQKSWLLFEAYYPVYTFQSGLSLHNVVQLAWLTAHEAEPEERYFYAENYGLVGWSSLNNGHSYINEIHAQGERPDNNREVIPCLNRQPLWFDRHYDRPLPYWPGNHHR